MPQTLSAIQERGLEFSAPNPLGQPFRHDVFYMWERRRRVAQRKAIRQGVNVA